MWQRIAFALALLILSGSFLASIRDPAKVPARPYDHVAILVSRSDLPQVETEIRSLAAERNIAVDDRSAGSSSTLYWRMVKDDKLRIEAFYDAYRNVVQICFFGTRGAENDYVADFKEALRLGLSRN